MTTSIPKKPNIAEISPHLICALCGGYLIDATTIVECLHSFCKTCIVRYLESSKYCPICEVLVHKTRPLQNIRLDQTLQDIVYKLVPGLFKDEMRRRREFYKDSPTIRSAQSRLAQQRQRVIYSADEKFSVVVENCPDGKLRPRPRKRSRSLSKEIADRRYLLCPANTTVALLKKFVRLKFDIPDKYKVDLFHKYGNIRDSYSLIDVAYIYSWKREGVLHLYYSVFKEPEPMPRIEITEVKEEVKIEIDSKFEDNRPSSLFSKASLLSNCGVDGDIPHDLSPLELIATVANDLSCYQEGRGLKRKMEEAPSSFYENDDENSNEIQIQKSIEHAIDLCSNNTNSVKQDIAQTTKETGTCMKTKETVKLKSNSGNIFENLRTSCTLSASPNASTIVPSHVIKAKPKEKPKTADTASQCDPKPKKQKGETQNNVPTYSKNMSNPSIRTGKPPKDGPNTTKVATGIDNKINAKQDKVKTHNNNNTNDHGRATAKLKDVPSAKQIENKLTDNTQSIPKGDSNTSKTQTNNSKQLTNQKSVIEKEVTNGKSCINNSLLPSGTKINSITSNSLTYTKSEASIKVHPSQTNGHATSSEIAKNQAKQSTQKSKSTDN